MKFDDALPDAGAWLRAQADAVEDAGPNANSLLTTTFAEEPVSLDIFVRDRKFIGMSALSDPQYEVLQASERIFYSSLYPSMAAEWSYWQPIPMVNFVTILSGKGCLVPGEEVYDADSGQWVPVEELIEPGVVASVANQCVVLASRSSSFRRGRGECYEVTTCSGRVMRVFGGHQFFTWDRHNRPAKNQFRDAVPTWRSLREMQVGDRIGVASYLPCHNPVRQDPRAIELVGLLIGDGHTVGSTPGTLFVPTTLSVGRDAPLTADRFEVLGLEECPGSKVRHNWHLDKYGEPTRQSIGFVYGKVHGKSALRDFTKRWGLHGCYAWEKRVPAEMMSLPDYQVWLLLSRLWDTDGSFYTGVVKKPKYTYEIAHTEYDTTSYNLAVDVQRLLLRVGIFSKLSSKKTSYSYKGEKLPGRISYRVAFSSSESVEYFCRNVTLLDKQADAEKCLAVVETQRNRVVERRALGLRGGGRHNPCSGDVHWDKIKSIKSIGISDYWDLSVDSTSNYVAGSGIFNHNSGKDLVSRLACLRIAYLLLCLRDPKAYFGFPSDESIHMLNVASTKNQARLAFFEPMTRIVTRGWFKDKCNPLRAVIEWQKGITSISGSSDAETQEGLNLILGVADEVDAFRTAEEVMRHSGPSQRMPIRSAEGIIKMMRTSSVTRFPQTFKNLRISYPRYYGSPILQLHAAAVDNIAKKGVESRHFVVGPMPSWDFNPLLARSRFVTIPQSPVPVPEELVEEFESDPDWSRAAYLCKPARTRLPPYFRNETVIDAALIEMPEISVNWELVRGAWHATFSIPRSLQPAPGAVYACHADLALTGDRCGFAIAHVVSWDRYEKRDVETGDKVTYEYLPVVCVDIALALEADLRADPPREIQLRAIRQLIFELRQRGFQFARASLDGYQSADSKQALIVAGIEAEIVSMDKTEEPYRLLRSMVEESRVIMPSSMLLRTELRGLQQDPRTRKIDHQPDGSKDISDAVCGSVWGAVTVGGAEVTTGEYSGDEFWVSAPVDPPMGAEAVWSSIFQR